MLNKIEYMNSNLIILYFYFQKAYSEFLMITKEFEANRDNAHNIQPNKNYSPYL